MATSKGEMGVLDHAVRVRTVFAEFLLAEIEPSRHDDASDW